MATIKDTIALEDKVSPTFSKIEKQAIANMEAYQKLSKEADKLADQLTKMYEAGQSNTQMYKKITSVFVGISNEMDAYANGTKNAKIANDKFKLSFVELNQGIELIKKGFNSIKGFINIADQTVQTTARLNMMNDGLQTTAELEDMIFNSAQRSRVEYQSMADTVAKLGMQAGEAFGSNKELLGFSELLQKSFKTAGMDATSIASTMYNMTQSLASGKLLGQDYRILKQNAPQMIKYLREYYNVNQEELDKMVSAGKVGAKDIKNAMFKASDQINEEFEKMPKTWGDVWTDIKNTVYKLSKPILNIISAISANWDKLKPIAIGVAVAIGIVALALGAYKVATFFAAESTWKFTAALLSCPLVWITLVIVAVVAALIYLWETNDDVAKFMIAIWDDLSIKFEETGVVFDLITGYMKAGLLGLGAIMSRVGAFFVQIWIGMMEVAGIVVQAVVGQIQLMVNSILDGLNWLAKGINNIFGTSFKTDAHVTWADDINNDLQSKIGVANKLKNTLDTTADNWWGKAEELGSSSWEKALEKEKNILDKRKKLDETRAERVANRGSIFGAVEESIDGMSNTLDNVIGTDGTGGKALKTTTNDNLLSDEDIQLLLDVATRDYKLNYQQVTPNITMTFGDIMETADVDDITDQLADKLQEIYDGNLGVT